MIQVNKIIDNLVDDLNIILSALWVPYKRVPIKGLNDVFEIQELGVIVVGVTVGNYSHMLTKLTEQFQSYRFIFVTPDDNIFDKKYDIIWDLMRSGYTRYIRLRYTRQFNNMIQQGLGRQIINERLKVWGDHSKYRYLIDENKRMLDMPTSYIFSEDPSFFDHMP